MRISTCEKCAKGGTCAVRKDKAQLFTGTCHSFLSYTKAASINEARCKASEASIRYTTPSVGLTYKPFTILGGTK